MDAKNPFALDSLDGQIWESLYYYPMLYRYGGQVLHHMYCVIGNGYGWDNGKLMHIFDDKDYRNDVYRKPPDHDFQNDELTVQFEIDRLRENHTIDFTRMHAQMLVKDRHRDWESLYPICEHARLACVPDDACEDFLAGARLAIDLSYGVLLKDGGLVQFHNRQGVRQRHDSTEASIQILDEAISGIIKRFGQNPLGIEKTGHLLWGSFGEYVDTQRRIHKRVRESLSSSIPET